MIKLLSGIGLVLVILIIAGTATCSVHSKLLSTDAATQPALDAAAAASQPLLAALDAYHHQNGYFPRNFAALQPEVAVPPDYVYEVIGMNRVYDSFACAARSNEFYGVIKDPASYQQRLTAFLSECVLGYASFVLKSSRIHTQRSINSNVVAFAKFSSQGGRWELDWCSSHPTPGSSGDCRHFAMNEAAMYDPESSDHRATHRVVHVGRPTPASAGREP